jgi:phosphoribosylanthranilate isomerase
MTYTRVKICGVTRPEDARQIALEGADAIGLVFYEKSPRCVTPERADEICRALPAFVTSVALFKDAGTDSIHQVLETTRIDCLQFHGSESAEFCRQFGVPYIKALGMGMGMGVDEGIDKDSGQTDVARRAEAYFNARGLLLDSHAPGADGGTGKNFDWSTIPEDLPLPLILAGGLDAGNVAEAIRAVRPYAVDVSSGVESEAGIKDAKKVTDFMQAVRSVNNE